MRKTVIAVVVLLLIAAVGVGGYLEVYRPSKREILTEPTPPMRAQMQATGMLPATPLSQLPQPDRSRFTTALHDAVRAIQPGYHVVDEQLFLKYGGYSWVAVKELSGEYLGSDFGYREAADAQAQVDGETVDYLIWRGGWLRRQFDDRLVLAVALRTLLEPDYGTMVFGYFVMRPA